MITQLDLSILDWIAQHLQCSFLDAAMPLVTALGDVGMFWIILAILLLLYPRTRKTGLLILLALALNFLICNVVLKPLVARVRPYEFRDVVLLVPRPTDYSFPSGHTSASFAAAAVLLREKQAGRWAFLALAVLIGLSRMYLFVHYPSDVLCGAVVGGACGILVTALLQKAGTNCKNESK